MALYLLIMHPKELVNVEGVQAVLNQHAQNWYRFMPGTWVVVCGNIGAQGLYDALHPYMPADGNMLVNRLTTHDRQGWMPQKFWDWLHQQM